MEFRCEWRGIMGVTFEELQVSKANYVDFVEVGFREVGGDSYLGNIPQRLEVRPTKFEVVQTEEVFLGAACSPPIMIHKCHKPQENPNLIPLEEAMASSVIMQQVARQIFQGNPGVYRRDPSSTPKIDFFA